MAKTPIDSDVVRSLAALLDETNLTEIEYEAAGLRIRVARTAVATVLPQAAPAAAPVAAPAPVAEVAAEDDVGAVKSPMVGVAYMSPEPGTPRFVGVGDPVAEGQTLMLIEAMKTFNPIRSPRAGKVVRILVDDGQPVEFGEPLFIIG
jgi:acetyl-CoA carboxylase biotin carboxyl carrier protein